MASVFVVRLNREWCQPGLIERAGRGGPAEAGAAFALAWTPCIGPTLGAILGVGGYDLRNGGARCCSPVCSAGLALPFLIAAVAFNAASRAFALFKRHYATIQTGAGVVLVGMGYLVLTGELFRINIEVQQWLGGFGLNFFQSV